MLTTIQVAGFLPVTGVIVQIGAQRVKIHPEALVEKILRAEE